MTNKIVQYWVTNLMVSSLCMITKRLTRCLDESIFINGTGYKTSNDEQVNCQFNTCIIFVRMNLTFTKSKLNCFFFLQSLTLNCIDRQVETFQWNIMPFKIVQYWVRLESDYYWGASILINVTCYKTSNDESKWIVNSTRAQAYVVFRFTFMVTN